MVAKSNIKPVLTEEQLAVFRRDGFVFVPEMFGSDDMARIESWTEEVVAYPEVPGRHMVYYEDSLLDGGTRVLSRIENFCAYHREFNRLLAGGRVLQAVGELFSEPATLFKDKINFKLPAARTSRRIRMCRQVGMPTRACTSRCW